MEFLQNTRNFSFVEGILTQEQFCYTRTVKNANCAKIIEIPDTVDSFEAMVKECHKSGDINGLISGEP